MSMPALEFVAKHEWPIFPCNPMDKRPLTPHGFKDATTDTDIIKSWWEVWPNAMIGVPMGPESGVFCLDLDRKPGSADGVATWSTLVQLHGNVPPTRMHVTPSTGMHMVFQWVPGIRNIPLNKLAPGIEVKGEGGYIVVPPSVMSDGKAYVGNDLPVAPAPQWLLDKMKEYWGEDGELEDELKRDAGKGTVDDFLERVKKQASIDEVKEALKHIPSDDYDIWYRIAGAIYKEIGDSGFWLFDEWSRKSKKYSSRDVKRKWKDAPKIKDISAGTIFHMANEHAPGWREKYQHERARQQQSGPQQKTQQKAQKSKIKTFSLFPIQEQSISTRPWIVPGLFLRGHLTLTAAPGGVGKSVMSISIAIMSALGKAWSNWRPRQRCKVLIINVEEDRDELLRRSFAIASKMGIDSSTNDLQNYIHAAEDPDSIIVAVYDNRSRSMIKQPLMDEIVELILREKYDLVIVDPFAETFIGEETNTELKWVGALWREVCRRARCAIWLIHHTKKYAQEMAGDIDAARGATALGNIIRIGTTMFFMTKEEAVAMGITSEERLNFVRFDDAKANYHLVSARAQWFKSETVTLQNQHDDIPGDNVGVLVPWNVPAALEGMEQDTVRKLLEQIDRGMQDSKGNFLGHYYTISKTQKKNDSMNRYVGVLIRKTLGKTEKQVELIIREWRSKNVLVEFDYKNPDRNWRKGCGTMAKKEAMEELPEAQEHMFKQSKGDKK